MSDEILISAFSAFAAEGVPVKFEQCHIGHINLTYFVDCEGGRQYVLQKINTKAFKNPKELMENIVGVTSHIRAKVTSSGGDINREVVTVIPTKDGKSFYTDSDGGAWRLYTRVLNAQSYNSAEFEGLFGNAGYAFGRFQRLLSDFPAEKLHETIPHFHDTVSRLNDLKASYKKNVAGRAALVKPEMDFILAHENICSWITARLADGTFPLRVTHNDTKLNNVMIDNDTHEGVCVIDLDTVMPGSALYDFGDSIRFGASNAAEDEKDLDKVFMRLELFEEFTSGFLRGLDGKLTEAEILGLPMSAMIITLEIGIRFLADYLDGDIYFANHYEGQNLDRARTQLKLVADMEQKYDAMTAIVKKYM